MSDRTDFAEQGQELEARDLGVRRKARVVHVAERVGVAEARWICTRWICDGSDMPKHTDHRNREIYRRKNDRVSGRTFAVESRLAVEGRAARETRAAQQSRRVAPHDGVAPH